MTTQASLVSREAYLAERSSRRNSDVKRSGWLLSVQFFALPALHASRFTVFLFATALQPQPEPESRAGGPPGWRIVWWNRNWPTG